MNRGAFARRRLITLEPRYNDINGKNDEYAMSRKNLQ